MKMFSVWLLMGDVLFSSYQTVDLFRSTLKWSPSHKVDPLISANLFFSFSQSRKLWVLLTKFTKQIVYNVSCKRISFSRTNVLVPLKQRSYVWKYGKWFNLGPPLSFVASLMKNHGTSILLRLNRQNLPPAGDLLFSIWRKWFPWINTVSPFCDRIYSFKMRSRTAFKKITCNV